jgi:hypothetical protein
MASLSKRTCITLAHPVEVDGVSYRQLSMRRVKPKDRSATYSGTDFEIGLALIARLCGVRAEVIAALHPEDLSFVATEVDDRFQRTA